jgi:hypothetical protein
MAASRYTFQKRLRDYDGLRAKKIKDLTNGTSVYGLLPDFNDPNETILFFQRSQMAQLHDCFCDLGQWVRVTYGLR